MQPLCQSHRDLNSGLRPVGAGPDLDSKKPVSTGSDLISLAGIPVVAVAGSHHDGWTVRVSSDTLKLFHALGRGEADSYVFPNHRGKGHLTRQAIGDVCRK